MATNLLKVLLRLIFGFFLMFLVHKIPYSYFKGISILSLPLVFLLLIYTASQGTVIAGANASRWIQIPFVGITFQTSTLASLVLFLYVARYLSKNRSEPIDFKASAIVCSSLGKPPSP